MQIGGEDTPIHFKGLDKSKKILAIRGEQNDWVFSYQTEKGSWAEDILGNKRQYGCVGVTFVLNMGKLVDQFDFDLVECNTIYVYLKCNAWVIYKYLWY